MEQQDKQQIQQSQPIRPSDKKFLANPKLPLIAALVVIALVTVGVILLWPQLKIDKCLGRGGIWDYEHSRCDTGNETPVIREHKVTIYAYEKDGSHIFDGAVIAAIDEATGKIAAEQTADRDGRIAFELHQGTYRIQPSPLRENRVIGSLILSIPLEENKPQRLLLTEVGPSAFGAPVDTCQEKYNAIEGIFDTANYCETDADCKALALGGAYIDFNCWKYMNKAYNTGALFQRMDEYVNSCAEEIDECEQAPQAVCKVGRCVQGKEEAPTQILSQKEARECRELVPNHNNLDENRIDIVLIGFDYTSVDKFLRVAKEAIGFSGGKNGLFSLEPLASNKDKFNIWYVARIGNSENQAKDNWDLSSICREKIGLNDHVFARKEHLFSDRMFTLFLVNRESKGHTAGQIYSFNPANYICTPQDDNGLCGLKGNRIAMAEDGTNRDISMHDFVHEFAHVFTMQNFYFEYRPEEYYNVLDEYIRFNEPYPAREYKNVVKDHSNCFVGAYKQCMSSANQRWGNMIGDGCGQDGVIDCCTNDTSAIQEGALSCEACPTCKEDPRYDLEIACYESCWASSGIYRSTLRSLMSSRIGTQEYGKLNEKLLCHQIKLFTGKAGGVCKELFSSTR